MEPQAGGGAMTDGPTIDERSHEEVYEELRRRAVTYSDEWDPYTDDPGTTLMRLFSRFTTDVTKRLNGVPNKHRVAFLNALGFARRPPQSARVPLTFTTAADIDENVVVPGGTQATAETEAGETEIFEIPGDDGFEATPATLRTVYSVVPDSNRIYDQSDVLNAGTERRLFTGTDVQRHEFYLGHDDLLNVDRGTTLTVSLRSPARETLKRRVRWEYYGEAREEAEEAGEVGWHPLPLEADELIEDPFGEDVALGERMRRVSDQVQRLGKTAREEEEPDLYVATFWFPAATESVEIAGTENRWIRGRIPGDEPDDFDIEIESARLDVEAGESVEATPLEPEMVFTNDVPVTIDEGDFYPLGKLPQPPTTLYIASEEAFTKRGGIVDVTFGAPTSEAGSTPPQDEGAEEDRLQLGPRGGPLAGPPEISWEYWNGNGWTHLRLDEDETSEFTDPGHISFTVPRDIASTSVSGHDNFWIRARLVSGNYGTPLYEVTDEGMRGELVQEPNPPIYGDITVNYRQLNAPFEAAVHHNNAAFHEVDVPDGLDRNGSDRLVPFRPLPDEDQTLYLGFDAPLSDGPINLYLPMQDKAYPSGFEPGVRWEYCQDPDGWTWKKLNVYDGTEGLTEWGIVTINFPTATTPFELFGERRHWIRARVTRDSFAESVPGSRADGDGRRDVERFELGEHGDRHAATPPTIEGIHPNTQWAYNEVTVKEVLGSSDGSPDQTFTCDRSPITGAEVWVNEAGEFTGSERRQFEQAHPGKVRRESLTGGAPEGFWVRWEEVPDFLDSGESSRHYTLDRTNGRVTFGDGQEGAIPPIGEENIESVYQTGGGSEGNVPAGSIVDLRSSISLIDSVTNLKQSDGGTDTEPLEEAVARAPRRIKNRGRAVSTADFEEIALEASPELATVKCEPGMDESGERSSGWVTLLIIPRERRKRPTPSLELRQRVRDAVSERAPATLSAPNRNRIVVRGPEYASVSVATTVDTRGVESITTLKNTIESALDEFFHPLTGGPDDDGWPFGSAPRLSRLSTLVEAIDGVDRVRDMAMTIETATEEKIIRDPETTPVLSPDEMVSSGTHEVTVIMQGRR